LLQNINLSLCHGKLDRHTAGGFVTLHGSHVVLQFVVGSRQPNISQGRAEIRNHGPEFFG
jgi:hypothetical protein